MTALTGGKISNESFAMSTAILAAPYVALQTDSLDDPGSLGAGSVGSRDGGAVDRAMALDEAKSVLWSFVRGRIVSSSCLVSSEVGGAGVRGGILLGVPDDDVFFRNLRIVGARQEGVHVQISAHCILGGRLALHRAPSPFPLSQSVLSAWRRACLITIENARWRPTMHPADERFPRTTSRE